MEVRRGFFTETDFGGFMTLGGDFGYSNLQPYLQLGLGYDVSRVIELGAHVGIGANAQNCFAGAGGGGACLSADSFTVMFIDATAAYLFELAERFYFTPKVAVGYTVLDPSPIGGSDRTTGVNLGIGPGIEYATHMDHFTIGVDVLARYVVGPNILSLQFFPRVKYTF